MGFVKDRIDYILIGLLKFSVGFNFSLVLLYDFVWYGGLSAWQTIK